MFTSVLGPRIGPTTPFIQHAAAERDAPAPQAQPGAVHLVDVGRQAVPGTTFVVGAGVPDEADPVPYRNGASASVSAPGGVARGEGDELYQELQDAEVLSPCLSNVTTVV